MPTNNFLVLVLSLCNAQRSRLTTCTFRDERIERGLDSQAAICSRRYLDSHVVGRLLSRVFPVLSCGCFRSG